MLVIVSIGLGPAQSMSSVILLPILNSFVSTFWKTNKSLSLSL